jgi:UDP-glucose 4-epimerase
LVTGGAGFIGSHLVETLLAAGSTVTVLDNLSTGSTDNLAAIADHPNFAFIEGTVLDEPLVEKLVQQADIIYHMAAAVGVNLIVTDPVATIETNILGSHSVITAAARHSVKVMLASTSEIYGKNLQVPFAEENDRVMGPTTKARWSYAESKAVDEFLAFAHHRQSGLPVVIFRLFNTVGPRQTGRYGMVMPRFVDQVLNGEQVTVYGDGNQSRCFMDVGDAVRAIVGLANSPEAVGEVFNVGSSEETTILALAQRIIMRVTGSEAPEGAIKLVSYDDAYNVGFEDMQRRVPDTARINAAIGWAPSLSLDDIIDRVVESRRGALGLLGGR